MAIRLIKIKEVISKTGKSRTAIWRDERSGLFPCRRQTGVNSVAWLEDEINSWIESRSKGLLQIQKFNHKSNN